MPEFHIAVLDEEENNLNVETFDDFSSCQKYAENAIHGSAFRLFEMDPFLWDEGDYLHGKRRFSGNIDWVRIPLNKEEGALC